MRIFTFLSPLFVIVSVMFTQLAVASASYTGSKACASCHQKQYQDWLESDHFKATAKADAQTVLGDFSNVTVNFHNIRTRFYKENGKFKVETLAKDNKRRSYDILYTLGHYPLQQYLVDIGDGHIHAMNIAWDSRKKEEGGQRWYHLQPDEEMTPENPFFWQAHYQNWNARCAECHTTDYQKNYDPQKHSYHSTWAEVNVGCEACHGPASEHLQKVKSSNYSSAESGFDLSLAKNMSWLFEGDKPIAKSKGQKTDQQISMCGGCHSRRNPMTALQSIDDFHEDFRLELLGDNLYFADGQIEDEVFVMGSFLQSKMHAKGVQCSNCHNPHSGKVYAKNNSLCAQCHKPEKYDTLLHHRHEVNSKGAQCVNCHMPERTYMGVDDRRDHSFTIPNPNTSKATDAPNACTGCHDKKDNQWARDHLKKWKQLNETSHWANVNHQMRAMDSFAVPALLNEIKRDSHPPIIRATLLQHLASFPSQETLPVAAAQLIDDSPLVRRSAVATFASTPPQHRWQALAPLLNDKNLSVRMEVLSQLLDLFPQMPPEVRDRFKPQIEEYRGTLKLTEDFPSTQVLIAMLETHLGNFDAAEVAYKQALKIEPTHFPALLNLSEFYRNVGQEDKQKELLEKALKVVPDSGTVQHSYGLFLIRQQNYKGALPYLEAALGKLDSQPRYAYVYAVALDELGETNKAISVLQKANDQWPNQVDVLSLLIMYYEKTNQQSLIAGPLNALKLLAPQSPQVQQWMQKYR